MKIIKYSDIKNVNIDNLVLIEWIIEALKNKSNYLLEPKISLKQENGIFCNVMPSIININNNKYGGVKVVTRYPKRIPSLDSSILLFDANNGNDLALMDGTWITTMRTGAIAAYSIKLFAKTNFNTIAIMGLGNVARATLLMLLSIFPDRKLVIKLLKYKDEEISFIKRFDKYNNIEFKIIDKYRDFAKNSDVIISGITYADHDFFSNDDFDEGVLLVPIHTLGFTNCDLFFDKVYGDDYKHISSFKNFKNFNYFAEVSEVVNHKKPGRENNKEKIIVYNVGIAIHDVYFAAKLYELLCNKKELVEFDLGQPVDKFWV